MEIFRVEEEGVASTESLKQGGGITLHELGLREEDEAGSILDREVLQGMNITAEAFNIPGEGR